MKIFYDFMIFYLFLISTKSNILQRSKVIQFSGLRVRFKLDLG